MESKNKKPKKITKNLKKNIHIFNEETGELVKKNFENSEVLNQEKTKQKGPPNPDKKTHKEDKKKPKIKEKYIEIGQDEVIRETKEEDFKLKKVSQQKDEDEREWSPTPIARNPFVINDRHNLKSSLSNSKKKKQKIERIKFKDDNHQSTRIFLFFDI